MIFDSDAKEQKIIQCICTISTEKQKINHASHKRCLKNFEKED
jgi:hypothetical protein